jgi:hypothetical protein
VKPVARVLRALRPAALDRQAKSLASLEASSEALQQDVSALRALLGDLSVRVTGLHADAEALLATCRDEAQEQARLGAFSGARLAADGIRLIGPPSARLRARRLRSGEAVDLPFGGQMGRTFVASTAPDVRELWERLLTREAGCVDDRLRGAPSTALEIHHATVALAGVPATRPSRRLYVSRRDAKPHRRWVDNEPDVEALFASRGFEIVSMRDCPLPEQARMFASARVVAGASGAGLADIVFSPPGTHVITLVSDELLRWYAAEGQSRALWVSPTASAGGELAQLGDSPRFYAHVAAAFGQISHSFVGPDRVPLEALSAFLDDVLARVDVA